ncbi:MAG: cation diffusion facilitator family transporter [Candidatus Methylomirabilales bacterium]
MKAAHPLPPLKPCLAVSTLLAALKLGAYLATGAVVLLMEALHSLTDLVVAALLLAAARRSARTGRPMWGHASVENLAGLVAAVLFVTLPAVLVLEGAVPRLLRPTMVDYRHLPFAAGAVLLAMLLTAAPLVRLLAQGPPGRFGEVRVVELVTDMVCLLIALAGVVLVQREYPVADPIAAIAIAPIIILNGIVLFRENANVLLRRSPGTAFLRRVEGVARGVRGVRGVHELRAEQTGPGVVRAAMHIEVPRSLPVEEADRIAHEVQRRVEEATGCQGCLIHVDPVPTPGAAPPAPPA